jgi:hypothetical protein
LQKQKEYLWNKRHFFIYIFKPFLLFSGLLRRSSSQWRQGSRLFCHTMYSFAMTKKECFLNYCVNRYTPSSQWQRRCYCKKTDFINKVAIPSLQASTFFKFRADVLSSVIASWRSQRGNPEIKNIHEKIISYKNYQLQI